MSILRTIECNICEKKQTENISNEGWPKWGIVQGKANEKGETDFHLCPEHLDSVFGYIKNLMGES